MSKKGKDSTEDMMDETTAKSDQHTADEQEKTSTIDSEATEESGQLEKELSEQKDKYLRLAAEFDNFRKRTARENLELRQTASRDLMTSLLDVLDDMDRAEVQITETAEKNELLEGILLIFNKFRKTLEQKGLKAIETMYTDFDVEKDEAISEIPVDDEKLKGKVVAEVQKGYMLNDRLIRFAKVVVGK